MKYTGNYNLKKPDGTDVVNIEDFNENADIIDAELKKLNDAIKDLDADGITLPDGKTIAEKFDEIETEVGNIEELNTDTKTNVIAAINEIYQEIVAHKADYKQHTPYAIASGVDSYAVNIPGITSLIEGMSIKVKFASANTGACTLNINGLGAKEIRKSNGNALSSGNIKAGQICHLVYTGSVFQLLGEGGEYGNVTPEDVIKGVTFGTEEGLKTGTLELTGTALTSDVLSGKSFYTTNPKSKQTGTMTNRGAVTHTITTQGGSYIIPKGYHSGSGSVKAQFANLVAGNIKKGVNIGGVTGTYEPVPRFKTVSIGDISTSSGGFTEKTFTKVNGRPIGYRVSKGFTSSDDLYDYKLFYITTSPSAVLEITLSSPDSSYLATLRIENNKVGLTQHDLRAVYLKDLYLFFVLD